jgi:hypothetical protein
MNPVLIYILLKFQHPSLESEDFQSSVKKKLIITAQTNEKKYRKSSTTIASMFLQHRLLTDSIV